jgi:8-oxo-dGTP pyrophosphatase MutT (NUDIX family)
MTEQDLVEYPVSAGGVVYRRQGNLVEFALCGRRHPETWSLPKGTPESGESIEQTALREVREETGLDVLLEVSLGTIGYWFTRSADKVRCRKTVHFFLMVAIGGAFELHDPEFDDVCWFQSQEALRIMTYPNEQRIAEKALFKVENQE